MPDLNADDAAGSPILGRLARAGFVARGLVYLIIAVLAIKLAVGESGPPPTSRKRCGRSPANRSARSSCSWWRSASPGTRSGCWCGRRSATGSKKSTADRTGSPPRRGRRLRPPLRHRGRDPGRGGRRIGSHEKATGGVLGWPGGTVLVALAGAVVVCVGIYQAYKGLAKKFLDEVKTDEMEPGIRKGYTTLGVFGYVARAVVFVLVGYGLIRAAVEYDPKKAVGLDGALHELAASSYGPVMLWVVAVGLAGFAIYSFADTRYQRV